MVLRFQDMRCIKVDYNGNVTTSIYITGIYPIKERVPLTDIKAAADEEYQKKLLKEFDLY